MRAFRNIARHVENTRKYGLPVVVAINRFSADSDAEVALLSELCTQIGVKAITSDHWALGGEGAEDLAREVVRMIDEEPADFRYLYEDDLPLWDKVRTIAQEMYGAEGIIADQAVRDPRLRRRVGRSPLGAQSDWPP